MNARYPPGGREGHALRPHAQRLGPRGRPHAGRGAGELPAGGRHRSRVPEALLPYMGGLDRLVPRLMRILLTNDDGIHAPGLAGARGDRAHAVGRHLDRRARRGAVGRGPFADAHPPVAAPPARREALSVTGTPTDAVMMALGEIMARRNARPDPVGRQSRRQSGRGRDLFGHRLGGDGGRAGRRPLDRAEPGLCARRHGRRGAVRRGRGLGRARAGAAARRAVRAAHAGQRQLPAAAAADGARHPRRPPGLARLWPAADRRGHRSARLPLLLVRARRHRRDAGARDRSRGDRRRLCLGHAAASRPDARCLAGAACARATG